MSNSGRNSFPEPDNAPEPGECIRVERPEDGLAVVVFDPPHRSLAVLDAPLLRDLESVLDELERDATLTGIVFTGRTSSEFLAGADIDGIADIRDRLVASDIVRYVHGIFRRIENLRPRTVAAVGGACPGGAYELSLSCDLIVAADSDRTRIGLPETQLGILPGWGGCHRLPERIGLPGALDAILSGRLYPAPTARKRGMVDRITPPERMLDVATDIAMGRKKQARRRRGAKLWLVDRNPLARALIRRQVSKQVLSKTHGHYPAPLQALDLVLRSVGVDRRTAEDREANAIGELATSPVCKSLLSIFFASEAAKKLGKGSGDDAPRKLTRAGVIGAGVMGGGIASVMARSGLDVRLSDLSQKSLDASLATHRADLAKRLKRRRMPAHKANAAGDRLTSSLNLDGLGRAEIVIEAIAERLDIKQQLFADLAVRTAEDCILATNTSSLSVGAIAEGVPHPERVVGMHFFNPVPKMPLVEIVRGPQTDDAVVRAVAALAVRMGKTPVIVADVAGFLVNRLLGPYLDEAVRLFVNGCDPARIDRQMKEFGMPMGPLRLLDEVGLDIAQHAAASLAEAYGERMAACDGIAALATPERLGAKTGRGFYVHPKSRKEGKPVLADDLGRFQTGGSAAQLGDQESHDRLTLGMFYEAARCLGENVVAGPTELDLATVFGTGFAPFRGGLIRHADSIGVAEVVRRLEALAVAPDIVSRPGGAEKFTPAPWLRARAARGGSLFA